MRRKQSVRVHLTDHQTTIEGVLMRRKPTYLLEVPKLIEQEGASISLDTRVEIPRERVLFWQVLSP